MNAPLNRAGAVRLHHDDDGITLVELIVGILVAGLFSGMLAMMFINGWNSQQLSVARDSATGQANLVRTTLADSLRNATAVRVSGGGSRVDAVVGKVGTSLSGWAWECRAWALHDDSIRYSAGTTARGTDVAAWAVLAGKSDDRPLDRVTGTLSGVPFKLTGTKGVQFGIDVRSGTDAQTVSLSGGMTAQAVATEGAPTCWT